MGTRIKKPFVLAASGVMLAGQMTGQTFTVLHSFMGVPPFPGPYTNGDGSAPLAGLIVSANALYGTAQNGGIGGNGTVFTLSTNGTGYTTLHSFATGSTNSFGAYTNADGANPSGRLLLWRSTLYGTAYVGGRHGGGTVFALNADGTGFTNLHHFNFNDGSGPSAGLIQAGNTLYGTTGGGGSHGNGTVFTINTDGTGFTNLYSFSASDPNSGNNSDGSGLLAGLILSSNTLYGMAEFGGNTGNGTVFRVNTDGSGFRNLHNFKPTGIFGVTYPFEGLILSGDTLYGAKALDGSTGYGTVFSLNADGSAFTNLYNFTGNNDGAGPQGGLILSSGVLYGTAQAGAIGGNGTVFAIRIDGTGFTNLYSFTQGTGSYPYVTNSDGAIPQTALFLSGNTLYGATRYGGSWGSGTIFSLTLPVTSPRLTIIPSGANVVLTWPTNVTGFTLESTTNLVSPFWAANLPAPVVVNEHSTVTNPISGTQQFFRLRQ